MKLRARAESDKALRADAILKAGRECWSQNPVKFSMAGVAARAGVAKGTLYLYFETKEDLLGAVAGRILREYLDRVDRALAKRRRWTLSQVAALFRDAGALPMFPNSDRARERIEKTAELIDACVAGLRHGDAVRFVRCAAAMLAGFASANRRDFQFGVAALAHGMEKRR